MSRNPSPAEPLDATPSPTPSPSQPEPTTPPTSPLFQTPTQHPLETPDPGSSETLDAPPSPGLGADSGSPRPGKAASPAAKRRELRKVAATMVGMVGGLLHDLLTPHGSIERDAGLYLPDDDDVEAIADPLAGLASRRMPEGAENPDVTDLIRLGFGLLGYALKQRGLRAQIAAAYTPADEEEPADEESAA